ncbi:hypothetical protein CRX42_03200 [Pseudomonas jessenii]|uniref:Uncharacterized protein n=1 Tax=Pseudomonas jessenii TaxID=77298 RepID=A0A2W0EUD5_PSEJE|nr:hypothetical protein [Pseudomonas jessenii]PYY72000.1 hypothetical protein CRX42_03200 [Pseudomonas jessenii]
MNVNFPALSMKADAYVVKNPLETTNSYTKKNAEDAVVVLKLFDESSLGELKDSLRGYDFTSVSTNELTKIGQTLYHDGLIDIYMYDFLSLGNMAFDEFGHKAETDVKFNAIAMFNPRLEERQAIGRSESASMFHEITRALVRVNHVLGALSFFANTTQNHLAVNIEA